MTTQKSLLCLVVLFAMPLCAQNEPSESGWSKYSPAAWYSYFLGKSQIPKPAEPVGLQLIPHIEPYKLLPSLRVVNMLSKMHHPAIHDFLESFQRSGKDQEVADVYKATEILKERHDREKNNWGYPATDIQKLQERLFRVTEDEKQSAAKKDAIPLSNGDFILIQTPKQLIIRDKVAQILGCPLESLFNKSCAPAIKRDGLYAKEELQQVLARRIFQYFYAKKDVHSKKFDWNIILDIVKNIDISHAPKWSGGMYYFAIDDFDVDHFIKDMQKKMYPINNILMYLKINIESIDTRIRPQLSPHGSTDIQVDITIKSPSGNRKLFLDDSSKGILFYSEDQGNYFVKYFYPTHDDPDKTLLLPNNVYCDSYCDTDIEKIIINTVVRYARVRGDRSIEIRNSAIPLCRQKLLEEAGFKYTGKSTSPIQQDMYKLSLKE